MVLYSTLSDAKHRPLSSFSFPSLFPLFSLYLLPCLSLSISSPLLQSAPYNTLVFEFKVNLASISRTQIYTLQDILPHLANPRLLIDFFTDAYNLDGPLPILALNGLFTLTYYHHLYVCLHPHPTLTLTSPSLLLPLPLPFPLPYSSPTTPTPCVTPTQLPNYPTIQLFLDPFSDH